MVRRILPAVVPVVAVLASWMLATSAVAATTIAITDAQLLDSGSAVQVTASVACDPLPADNVAFLSVDLWQGKYPHPNYIEGSGSYGEIGGASLTCDGTAHSYSVTVTPSQFYADKRFRPGAAMSESVVVVCDVTDPQNALCQPGELIRQSFRIHR
jgi:hypothetical protein